MFRRLLQNVLPLMFLMHANFAFSAVENRDLLKTYFETGDVPTETQFTNLIESVLNVAVDYGVAIDQHMISFTDGVGNSIASSAPFRNAGVDVKALEEFKHEAKVLGRLGNHPNVVHFIGVQFQMETAGVVGDHFGFLTLSVAGPASSTPYAVYLHGFSYESSPGASILTSAQVPIPSALWLYCSGFLLVFSGRYSGLNFNGKVISVSR